MKAAIAIEKWKLEIFERHLKQAGYTFTNVGGLTKDTVVLTVVTDNPEALKVVVTAAMTEAARTGKPT